jgi:acetyltransferase-like isoleucine patch superfamily enzyme
MSRIFFRSKRRLEKLIAEMILSFKLVEVGSLYPNRFYAEKSLSFGKQFSFHFDHSNSSIHIGNNVQFRDHCQIRSGSGGVLRIGDNVFFNNNCGIHCFHKISIGNDCQFGEGVKFYDVNHKFSDSTLLISEQGYKGAAIQVGNNCWFGSNVIVLKGVTIGDNVVIGAGCIVHESIPSNTIVTLNQNLNQKQIN